MEQKTQGQNKEPRGCEASELSGLVIRLKDAANDFPVIQENPKELLEDAAAGIEELQSKVDNMAMLMRMLLSERQVNRQAKKYLINNDLMGSPLRGV